MKATQPVLLSTLLWCRSADAFSQLPRSRGLVPQHASPSGRATTPLFSAPAAAALPEGISKTVTAEGSGRPIRVGDVVVAKYFCTSAGSTTAFARSERQRVVAGDGTMIRGWDAVRCSGGRSIRT